MPLSHQITSCRALQKAEIHPRLPSAYSLLSSCSGVIVLRPTFPFDKVYTSPKGVFFYQTMDAIVSYFRGSLEELRHVRWPTRQQAVRLTLIVIAFIIVNAVLLAVIDSSLTALVDFVVL